MALPIYQSHLYENHFYSLLFKLNVHMLCDCNYAPQGVRGKRW